MSGDNSRVYVKYPSGFKAAVKMAFKDYPEKETEVLMKLESGDSTLIRDLDDITHRYDNISVSEVLKIVKSSPEDQKEFIRNCRKLEFARRVFLCGSQLVEDQKGETIAQQVPTSPIEVYKKRRIIFNPVFPFNKKKK